MRVPSRALAVAVISSALLGLAAQSLRSAEPEILYPAKVMTKQGRIHHLRDLGHELARGSFVIYDGETEGRVPWRDIDTIEFVGNIKHVAGASGPRKPGTQRVELTYVDGQKRYVNLVIGKVRGFDGVAQREVNAEDLTVIDFDTTRIAPALYKTCEHGHVWEQPSYNYCPYDGLGLTATRLDLAR